MYLVKNIGVSTLKVGSGDLTNAPVLLHMARFRLPIILSTGMATLAEVERALGVIASGYLRELTAHPTIADFSDTLLDREAWVELHGKVTLLHCTTEYPAASHSINLRAMSTLRSAFGLRSVSPTKSISRLIARCQARIIARQSNPMNLPRRLHRSATSSLPWATDVRCRRRKKSPVGRSPAEVLSQPSLSAAENDSPKRI